MFSQSHTPYLSYPKSDIYLNEAGIGLPHIRVRTHTAFMANLRGPGITAKLENDPGHADYTTNPFVSDEIKDDQEADFVSRQFSSCKISSVYHYEGREYKGIYSIFEDKALCQTTLDHALDQPLELKGQSLGECWFNRYQNGLSITEHRKDLRPATVRIIVNAWTEGSQKAIPVAIKTDPHSTVGNIQYISDCLKYAFVLPAKTSRFEIIIEFVADADPELQKCSLMPQGERLTLREIQAAEGFQSEYYFQEAESGWEAFHQNEPKVHIPDQKMNAFLNFSFMNQQACEFKPLGLMPYPFMMAKGWFCGFWGWDYSFHSISSRWLKDQRLAKGSLLTTANLQWDDGCISNAAVPSGVTAYENFENKINLRPHLMNVPQGAESGSQPPVLGDAVLAVYHNSGDKNFLRQMLPVLERYQDWHETNRLSTKYPDLITVTNWLETGQDNSKRLGNNICPVFKDSDTVFDWSAPIIPPDINTLWAIQTENIGTIHQELGNQETAKKYFARAGRIKAAINKYLWNDQAGFYSDLEEATGRFTPVYTPAGFVPMAAGIPSQEQYQKLKKVLFNEKKFWTKFPLPTCSIDDPDFKDHNSYWMGAIWFYFNYYVLEGLYRYDKETAEKFLQKNIDLFTRRGFVTAFENYSPNTGEGFNIPHFLWSALISDSILKHTCGIQPSKGTLRLDDTMIPEDWGDFSCDNLSINGGPLKIERRRNKNSVCHWTVTNKGQKSATIVHNKKSRKLDAGKTLVLE